MPPADAPQRKPSLAVTPRRTFERRLHVLPPHDHPPVCDQDVGQQPRAFDFAFERVEKGVFGRVERLVDVFQEGDHLVRMYIVRKPVRLSSDGCTGSSMAELEVRAASCGLT